MFKLHFDDDLGIAYIYEETTGMIIGSASINSPMNEEEIIKMVIRNKKIDKLLLKK